ncbi:hypothetical protein ALT1000_430024 [Alteromonas macleodii]
MKMLQHSVAGSKRISGDPLSFSKESDCDKGLPHMTVNR